MKILFDHQVFSWQKFGGISRYFAELIHGLNGLGEEASLPSQFFSQNIHLQEIAKVHRRPLLPSAFVGKSMLQHLLGRRGSLKSIARRTPDVFHPTYFDWYFLPEIEKRGIPFVLTVHDMIHEKFRHGHGRFSIDAMVVPGKKILAEKAAAIVCVSENTKRDLLETYPQISPEKVHVVWHGNSLKPDFSSPFRLGLPEKYLLFVGNRSGYKNFSGLARDLAPFLKKEKTLQLICAGGAVFSPEELKNLQSLGILGQAQHVKFHGDDELAEIYRRAACFIFPSKYEGFGIPILESFACGCPAVLNEASSLPEVGAAAAAYYQDGDGQSLENAIRFFMDSEPNRLKMNELAKARLREFTWENSVGKHLEIYKNVADGHASFVSRF